MSERPGSSGMVCKSSLREFFLLTDKWIVALGPPDKTVPNPHYRRAAAPMQLWAVARVEEFVAAHADDPQFVAMQAKRRETIATRETRRTIREEKRAAELRAWAVSCEISIWPLPDNLCKALRRSHAQRDNGYFTGNGETKRDALNFVRHERSNYHDLLDELANAPDTWEAYETIKARVNELALKALQGHPQYADLPGSADE